MSAGIIDHEAGTRDATRLGGVAPLMPVTFVIATLASLSMAGIPFLNGFLSKEMMLEETLHTRAFRQRPCWCRRWRPSARSSPRPTRFAMSRMSSSGRSGTTIRRIRTTRPSACGGRRRCWWWPWSAIGGVAPFLAEPLVRLVTGAVRQRGRRCRTPISRSGTASRPALWMSVTAGGGRHRAAAAIRPAGAGLGGGPPPFAKTIYDRIIAQHWWPVAQGHEGCMTVR